MTTTPLGGITVAEIGNSWGIAIAGLLLGELGATVIKVTDRSRHAQPTTAILHRGKTIRDNRPENVTAAVANADVVLIESAWLETIELDNAVPTVVFTDSADSLSESYSPAESMLAEAASGIMALQLGHRDGPFCLASPIAGYGAGVLGALSATSGLLANVRGRHTPWRGTVSNLDGALAFQTLSASFVRDTAPDAARARYRDPYSVSFSPLLRFHEARDGWVFIGAISDHMWKSMFSLIGREDLLADQQLLATLPFNIEDQTVGEDLARSISNWVAVRTTAQIVDLLTTKGVVVAPVLSSGQFLKHPQCAANGLPFTVQTDTGPAVQVGRFLDVVSAEKLSAKPLASPTHEATLPLAGLRVLDVSRHAAGPVCGRVLADLGADVVRVEAPDGDTSRAIGMTFAATNRGKLSLGIDVKGEAGRDVINRAVDEVDIILTNALPDAAARLGIDWDSVSKRSQDATVVTILGFGRKPPFGGQRVVDAAAQALSGQALAEGGGTEPVGCTGGFLDNGAGWLAALGGVAALYNRQTAHCASRVETSLLNTSAFIQIHRMADLTPTDWPSLDSDRTGYNWAQRLYPVSDGWICIASTRDSELTALRAAAASVGVIIGADETELDLPEWTAFVGSRSTAEIGEIFDQAGFAAWTSVATLEQVARTRHDLFVTVQQEQWGDVLQPGRLPRVQRDEAKPVRGAPDRPGGANAEALKLIGFDMAEIDQLIKVGAIYAEAPLVQALPTSV